MYYHTDRSARTANYILCPNYPSEQVALIPPHPEWVGLTLGNMKNIGSPAVAKLARDQGLTPSENLPDSEVARIQNLNMILRHLGVSRARLRPFSLLNLTRLMVDLFSGQIPSCSLVERRPPHLGYEKVKSLATIPRRRCPTVPLSCVSRPLCT